MFHGYSMYVLLVLKDNVKDIYLMFQWYTRVFPARLKGVLWVYHSVLRVFHQSSMGASRIFSDCLKEDG